MVGPMLLRLRTDYQGLTNKLNQSVKTTYRRNIISIFVFEKGIYTFGYSKQNTGMRPTLMNLIWKETIWPSLDDYNL